MLWPIDDRYARTCTRLIQRSERQHVRWSDHITVRSRQLGCRHDNGGPSARRSQWCPSRLQLRVQPRPVTRTAHFTFRFSAELLPRLLTISYSTCWFSFSVLSPARSTAEICTKTSGPPPVG